MKNQNFFFILLLGVLFASCNDDDITNMDIPIDTVYPTIPLEIGNRWIYNHFTLSEEGDTTGVQSLRAVEVIGDTMILGNTYAVLADSLFNPKIRYIRDSSGILLDEIGRIIYSFNSTFTESFAQDTVFLGEEIFVTSSAIMDYSEISIETEAGIIDCSTLFFESDVYEDDGSIRQIIDRTNYAPNIGLVRTEGTFVNIGLMLVSELQSYELN